MKSKSFLATASSLAVGGLMTLAVGAAPAHADLYDCSYTGPSNSASGTLTTSGAGLARHDHRHHRHL